MSAVVTNMETSKPNRAAFADELARLVSSATVIRCNEPLAKRTTLRVGGPADVYVEPASEADLAAATKAHRIQLYEKPTRSMILFNALEVGFAPRHVIS